jgi:pSer/pThr/pTyr-binding forkhead associated (FHA) protein
MLWLQLGHERIPLRHGEITLGRSHYCTLVVSCPSASRQHAALQVRGDHVVVSDLGSRNGTSVNGVRITGPTRLNVGDVISIGSDQCHLVESALSDDSASTQERMPASTAPDTTVRTLPDSD